MVGRKTSADIPILPGTLITAAGRANDPDWCIPPEKGGSHAMRIGNGAKLAVFVNDWNRGWWVILEWPKDPQADEAESDVTIARLDLEAAQQDEVVAGQRRMRAAKRLEEAEARATLVRLRGNRRALGLFQAYQEAKRQFCVVSYQEGIRLVTDQRLFGNPGAVFLLPLEQVSPASSERFLGAAALGEIGIHARTERFEAIPVEYSLAGGAPRRGYEYRV